MDLTTVENVRGFLSLTTTADDPLLETLIKAASAFIERYISRAIDVVSYADIFSGNGRDSRMLRFSNVQRIVAVTIDDQPIQKAEKITDRGFMLDDDQAILFNAIFPRGVRNCRIDYTAGWAEAPADIQLACNELVAYRYRNRERIGLISKVMQGETITYAQKDMPDHVRMLLNPFRRVAP